MHLHVPHLLAHGLILPLHVLNSATQKKWKLAKVGPWKGHLSVEGVRPVMGFRRFSSEKFLGLDSPKYHFMLFVQAF